MSRMEFATEAAAQSAADRIHTSMIATNPEYAASVTAGKTLRWGSPYQDLDDALVPISTKWYVNVKTKALSSLTSPERTALKQFRTKAV